VFFQARSKLYPDKRAAWLLDEKGLVNPLAEFFASNNGDLWKDEDLGLCSFRAGRFPTRTCTWAEFMDEAHQM
jgi:hypothetical protein